MIDLPADYTRFFGNAMGTEGALGDGYVMLWSPAEIGHLNDLYEAQHQAPGLVLFGSDGGGNAFAFDTRVQPFPVVRLPFVGMSLRYVEPVAPTFSEFIAGGLMREGSNRARGLEIFEVHPVVLGGHPVDPANKTLLTRTQHIEAVCYWNKMIRGLRANPPM